MIRFPIGVLTPDAVSFVPNVRNAAGSSSLSGSSQIVGSALGLWEAKLVGVALRGARSIVLWETIEILLEGRMNPILIPVMEGRRQPFPASQPGPYVSVPHHDGAFFSDGSGYHAPVILAALSAPVARGAVEASIRMEFGRALQPRDYFSLGPRLYRIKSVERASGAVQTVKFWPRARDAVAAGTFVELDRPACKMRLKTDTGMAVDKDLSKFAAATVEFVEDLS